MIAHETILRIDKAKRSLIPVVCLVAVLACCATSATFAANYYWDNNGSTNGFGTANGTWAVPTIGNAAQGWSTSSGGTLVPGNVTTTTADDVNFGTASLPLAVGTVTNSPFVIQDGGAVSNSTRYYRFSTP